MQEIYRKLMKLVFGTSVESIMAPLTRISGELSDLSADKVAEGEALSELATEAFTEHGKAEKALEKLNGFLS